MSDKSAISKRQLRQWMREAKSLERVINGGQVTIAELGEPFYRVMQIVLAIKSIGNTGSTSIRCPSSLGRTSCTRNIGTHEIMHRMVKHSPSVMHHGGGERPNPRLGDCKTPYHIPLETRVTLSCIFAHPSIYSAHCKRRIRYRTANPAINTRYTYELPHREGSTPPSPQLAHTRTYHSCTAALEPSERDFRQP